MEDNIPTIAKTKQPKIYSQFMHLIQSNTLSHAYLFTGEDGVGQFEIAMAVAMRLFCLNVTNNQPCGKCPECQRIMNFDHPDVVITEPEGLSIKVDQIRHIKSEFSKSAVEGSQKVFIISDADKMTVGAANSLLKFIEEPVGNVVTFLISRNKNLILPTILSRTQVIEFSNLNRKLMIKELQKENILPSQLNLLISLTNSKKEINTWLAQDWFGNVQKQVAKWFSYIINDDRMAFPFIQMSLMPLINSRKQQTVVLSMMVRACQDMLNFKYQIASNENINFPMISDKIKEASSRLKQSDIVKILDTLLGLNMSLTVNVNFQNIIESATLKILDIIN